jgi:hypothetical protein
VNFFISRRVFSLETFEVFVLGFLLLLCLFRIIEKFSLNMDHSRSDNKSFKEWCLLCANVSNVNIEIMELNDEIKEHIGMFSVLVRLINFLLSINSFNYYCRTSIFRMCLQRSVKIVSHFSTTWKREKEFMQKLNKCF